MLPHVALIKRKFDGLGPPKQVIQDARGVLGIKKTYSHIEKIKHTFGLYNVVPHEAILKK